MRTFTWFFLLGYMAFMVPVMHAAAQGQAPIAFAPDHVYKIVNVKTGKVLEVGGEKDQILSNGRYLACWNYWGGAKQQWYIRPNSDGTWSFINRNSGLYFNIGDVQWTDSHHDHLSQWHFRYYYYPNQSSTPSKWLLTRTGTGQHFAISILDKPFSEKTYSLTFTDAYYPPSNDRPLIYAHVFCDGAQDWDIVDVSTNPGVYTINNLKSGKALEVGGADPTQGAYIGQWSYFGAASQQWVLQPAGNGYFSLLNRSNGLCLEMGGSYSQSVAGGRIADQWPYYGNDNQQWSLVDASTSSQLTLADASDGRAVKLVNRRSGQVLEIGGSDADHYRDGKVANQWGYWGGQNQKWTIKYVSPN